MTVSAPRSAAVSSVTFCPIWIHVLVNSNPFEATGFFAILSTSSGNSLASIPSTATCGFGILEMTGRSVLMTARNATMRELSLRLFEAENVSLMVESVHSLMYPWFASPLSVEYATAKGTPSVIVVPMSSADFPARFAVRPAPTRASVLSFAPFARNSTGFSTYEILAMAFPRSHAEYIMRSCSR